jgi:hypothetical protein
VDQNNELEVKMVSAVKNGGWATWRSPLACHPRGRREEEDDDFFF